MIHTVTVGPLSVFFGNANAAMQLRGHYHYAQVLLVYGHREGDHGWPSFLATNNALREHLQAMTGRGNIFRDATNEDVAERLFRAAQRFCPTVARDYGGRYWLQALHLDVYGTQDDIGHDNGVTRYTVDLGAPVTRGREPSGAVILPSNEIPDPPDGGEFGHGAVQPGPLDVDPGEDQ